jgi:hypothetical protein
MIDLKALVQHFSRPKTSIDKPIWSLIANLCRKHREEREDSGYSLLLF